MATLRASPPTGEQWQYEIKFDGFRIQLHKAGLAATLCGKNGGDLTTRFRMSRKPARCLFDSGRGELHVTTDRRRGEKPALFKVKGEVLRHLFA